MPPIGPNNGQIVSFPFSIFLDKRKNGSIPNPCTYRATVELFEDAGGIKSTGIAFNIYLSLYRGWK